MARQVITLPYEPRSWFRGFHDRTERIAVSICHRRCGKTYAAIADLIDRAIARPNGRYAFLSPYYRQSKAVAWDYLRELAAPVLAKPANESELKVELINGARIQLFGADNPDALRGLGLDGAVCDEFADMRGGIWEVLRPALADRKGWVVFIGTPKGHAGLYPIWKGEGQWAGDGIYRLMLRASDTEALDADELADMRMRMTDDEYAQELECSFEAAIKGSVFGSYMAKAATEGRITGIPYERGELVYSAWDLGIGDATAIWFFQMAGKEIHIFDYYESSGVDVAHYAKVLKDKRYDYGGHILPHDAEPKEYGSGKSIKEVLDSLGVHPLTVLPVSRIEDGINTARLTLSKCWFDARRCDRGIEALRLYRYEFDDKRGDFKSQPLHDWTSHAADAFRYLSEGVARGVVTTASRPLRLPKLGIA